MGGFLGIGNSPEKTDRGNQLAGVSADWSVFNRGLPAYDAGTKAGTSTTQTGLDTLGTAQNYWQNITQGNKTALNSAAAPAANAVQEVSDASKAEQAQMGTARGGGVAGANQQTQTAVNSKIDDTSLELQPKAATALTSIGTEQANVGQQQKAEALQALGLSAETAREIIQSSIESRPVSEKARKDVQNQWSTALASIGL